MPSLQDIEQFKEYLNSLGNEPAILAERGQSIQDVHQPQEGLSQDLSDLFDDVGTEGPDEDLDMLPADFLDTSETVKPETHAEEPGVETDFFTSESTEEEEEFGPDEFTEAEPAMEEEGFDIPGFEDEVPGEADFALPEVEGETAGEEEFGLPEFEEEAGSAEGAKEEDFGLGGFEEPESGAEEEFAIPGMEESGEETGFEEAPLEDEFALPEFEEEAAGEEEFGIPEFGEEAANEEEFGLPEFGEETEAAEGAKEEDFGLGGFEESGPETEEEFDIPGDEEGFDIGFPGEEEIPASTGSQEEGQEPPVDFFDEDEFGSLETLEDEGFNLDFEELGDHFGISGEEAVEEAVAAPIHIGEAAGVEELHEGTEDYEIEDFDFEAVKETLAGLPRNLKLAIEELIGEKGLSGERLRSLVGLLISGASAKEIAGLVSRITGKKIEIPTQYEKKTGEEFEAEKGTFAYAFRQNILPMLKIFVPAVLAVLLLIFIGVRFVYRPLKAISLYRTGYEEIDENRFDSANSYFDRAGTYWEMKKWFYTYAEGFIEQRKYRYAEDKYLSLLARYPEERDGRLALAELQGMTLGKYLEAEEQLQYLFDKDRYDREALLLSGDMYMQWAFTVPDRYEDARKAYAALIRRYGQLDVYLFRMLRYFIRTDNYEEVMRLKLRFESNEKAIIDPVIYAELGGYLIDKNELVDVRKILFRAMDLDETVPEIHYNLSRLFRKNQEYTEEDKALAKAIYNLENEEARTPSREGMLIDSYTRRGERLYEQNEYLDAETSFLLAREHYENALRMRLLAPLPRYGRIYNNLADLYYYQAGDLDTAEALYELAEKNVYKTPDLDFKRGYIYFRRDDFKDALLRFYDAGEGFSLNENLLYATANTLVERGDFFAAQGYYDHLLDILENRKRNISHFLIDARPDHRALVENLMKTFNNQGVTLYNLALKTGDQRKIGDALYYFTESIELYDYLSRNPETMESSDTVNLAFLNSRSILYPVGNFRQQIYRDIPRDMSELFF